MSLFLPLYFACTQLRDNLAIYHGVVGAERSYGHGVWLVLEAEIWNDLRKRADSGRPETDWKFHL